MDNPEEIKEELIGIKHRLLQINAQVGMEADNTLYKESPFMSGTMVKYEFKKDFNNDTAAACEQIDEMIGDIDRHWLENEDA